MGVEITPEPAPEERDALLAGIERLLTGDAPIPPQYASAWRRAGLLEATGREPAAAPAPAARRGSQHP